MKFVWLKMTSNLILAVFALSTTVLIYQNCEPVHYSASIGSNGTVGAAGNTCVPASYGTQPFTNGNIKGSCTCSSGGLEICQPTGCTDPASTFANGVCTGPVASTLGITINGQTSTTLIPSTSQVPVVITATGPVHNLDDSQTTISRIAGTCAVSSIAPADLKVPGGLLALGTQSFTYTTAVANLIKGCTWRVTAVTDTGAKGTAEFTALYCSAGAENPAGAICTTEDGKTGTSACTADGLSYQCTPNKPVNCSFNGNVIPDGGHVTAFSTATVPYGQLCSGQTRTCANGVLSGTNAFSTCSETPGASCSFNGQLIADGAQVTGYATSNVAFGSTCQSGAMVCHNGNLIGNYPYPTCSVSGNPNCSINGQTVNDGQTIVVYNHTTEPFGTACDYQKLTCNNGVVSGAAGAAFYTNSSCQVQPPASCNFNGTVVAHGSGITGWKDSVVAFGSTCTSEYRNCTNGTLTGSYGFMNCSVTPGKTCAYNGQNVPNGSSVQGFEAATAPYGGTCYPRTSVCNDGTLSKPLFPSCTVDPGKPCSYNGQNIANGTVITGFAATTVPFGQTCGTATATCKDGTISGTVFPTCQVQGDPNCYVNGQKVADGQSMTFYSATQVPFAKTCSSVSQTRACHTGVLSGDTQYQYLNCSVTPPVACPFGETVVQSGATVDAFSMTQVEPGNTCPKIPRTCTNGSLSGEGAYIYPSCKVRPPNDCVFQGTIYHDGQSVTAYLTNSVSYGSTCSTEVRVCHDGTFSGSAQYPACSPNAPATCTFAGQTIAHGASVTAYSSTSSETCPKETATCNNGVLPLDNGFTYSSCTVVLPAPKQCVYSQCKITSDHNKIACGYADNGFHPEAVCSGNLIYGTYEGSGGTGPTMGPGPMDAPSAPGWAQLPAVKNIPGTRCIVYQKMGYSTSQYIQNFNQLYYDGPLQPGASNVPNVSCTSTPSATPVPTTTATPTQTPITLPTSTPRPGVGGGGGCLTGKVGLMATGECD